MAEKLKCMEKTGVPTIAKADRKLYAKKVFDDFVGPKKAAHNGFDLDEIDDDNV